MAVEGLAVAGGVDVVLPQGAGEGVVAGEVVFGAHVKVLVLFVLEYGVDAADGGHADGAGGESGVQVGVVGGFGLEVFGEDAVDGEVADGKFDGGIGLQAHAAVETVEVKPRYTGLFVLANGFFIYYGGECGDLQGGEAQRVGLAEAFFVPKFVVFVVHPFDEGFGTGGPEHLVGIGEDDAQYGVGGCVVLGQEVGVGEGLQEGEGVGFEAFGELTGQLVMGAYIVECYVDGALESGTQEVDDFVVAHAVFEEVTAATGAVVVAFATGYPGEVFEVIDGAAVLEEGHDFFEFGVAGDVEFDLLALGGLYAGGKDAVVIAEGQE